MMVDYMENQLVQHGTPWNAVARHMLGLRNGLPGSRRWRQVWSDHRLKTTPVREVAGLAAQACGYSVDHDELAHHGT